jgi:hypothetical protein
MRHQYSREDALGPQAQPRFEEKPPAPLVYPLKKEQDQAVWRAQNRRADLDSQHQALVDMAVHATPEEVPIIAELARALDLEDPAYLEELYRQSRQEAANSQLGEAGTAPYQSQ